MVQLVMALPVTLDFDAECLGTTTATKLAGLDVEIVLPSAEQYPDGRPYVGPPPTPGVREDIDWSEQLHYEYPWGGVVSTHADRRLGKGAVVEVDHLLLRVRVEPGVDKTAAQGIADQVVPALKPWMHLLADWVEVIRKTYLDRAEFPGEQRISIGSDLVLWYFDGERGHSLSRGMIVGPPGYIGRKGMALSEWHLALGLAEAQRKLPTEYVYLRDARGLLRGRANRRSVLDSATAAEISLAKLLDAHIASESESDRKAIRKSNNNLGRLITTLPKKYGIALRDDIQSGLATPRNDAIHAGIEPSRDAVRLALDIAAELVELATPYAELVRLDP
jgi:hypothetical protein